MVLMLDIRFTLKSIEMLLFVVIFHMLCPVRWHHEKRAVAAC